MAQVGADAKSQALALVANAMHTNPMARAKVMLKSFDFICFIIMLDTSLVFNFLLDT